MSISSVSLSSLQRPSLAEMHEKMFQKADTDGNDSVSKDELKAMMANAPKHQGDTQQTESVDDLFGKIDTDGDGQISKTENDSFMEARDKEMAAKFGDASSGNVGAFTGSSDILKSLMDALKKSDDESDSSSSSNSAQSSKTQTAREKLIAALLEQSKKQDNQYSATGVTTAASSANLFSTIV